jgi:predicted nucleotidyltransferase
MRTKNLATALFGKTRLSVLRVLVLTKKNSLHLREIARQGNISVSGARTELGNLEDVGIIMSEKSGNQVLYRINPDCPLYPEIRMLIIKTYGLFDEIRDQLRSIKAVKTAYIFGSFASGTFNSGSDIDLMVIGNVDPRKIYQKLMAFEKTILREINVKIYSPEEYEKQLLVKNSFVSQVHSESKIVLIQ